eukprot:3329890-Alexandrium_andersonii.AAC.1
MVAWADSAPALGLGLGQTTPRGHAVLGQFPSGSAELRWRGSTCFATYAGGVPSLSASAPS